MLAIAKITISKIKTAKIQNRYCFNVKYCKLIHIHENWFKTITDKFELQENYVVQYFIKLPSFTISKLDYCVIY